MVDGNHQLFLKSEKSTQQAEPQTPAKMVLGEPHTPANMVPTPLPLTPRKPGRHPRARGGAEEVSPKTKSQHGKTEKGLLSDHDVGFSNSTIHPANASEVFSDSPKTQERLAKLVEKGRGVGEFNDADLVPELRVGGLGACTSLDVKGKGKEVKVNPDEIDLDDEN
jgi:hypothetical protein